MRVFFFFNDTATTEIYTLSLHDALPICRLHTLPTPHRGRALTLSIRGTSQRTSRSEEHTSELQSRQYLVCRLLLEKKKNQYHMSMTSLKFIIIDHYIPLLYITLFLYPSL